MCIYIYTILQYIYVFIRREVIICLFAMQNASPDLQAKAAATIWSIAGLYTHICMYMPIGIYVSICTYLYPRPPRPSGVQLVCMPIYVCTLHVSDSCITYTYEHTYNIHTYIHIHTCMHIHVHVHVHTCAYTHTYIYQGARKIGSASWKQAGSHPLSVWFRSLFPPAPPPFPPSAPSLHASPSSPPSR
jgi:hypothetical protein